MSVVCRVCGEKIKDFEYFTLGDIHLKCKANESKGGKM